MERFNSKPFISIDVDENSTIKSLEKKFDELFPNTVIRLKIKGNYSSFFYKGKGMWAFLPNKKSKIKKFSLKISTKDFISDYLEKDQLLMLNYFGLNLNDLNLATDAYLLDQTVPGIFFTDGKNLVIEESLFENSQALINFFVNFFDAKIVLDLSNNKNNGIIILRTDKNFGVIKND